MDQTRPRSRWCGGGRPRLDRDRHVYQPALERPLVRDMEAAAAGLPISAYLESVISDAHDYHGPYLPTTPLSLAVGHDELRARTAAIERSGDLGPVGPAEYRTVRLDRPLANQINARCDELDIAYSDYLRAVLRIAHGHTPKSLRAAGVQDRLEFGRGVGSHQRAS